MRWNGLLYAAFFFISTASAVFQDDAYKIDYHEALLGLPQPHTTFFHKPRQDSSASLLYTLSDKLVLGAVNPRDGTLVWRQAIAGQPQQAQTPSFVIAGEDGTVTTAYGNQVKRWNAGSGRLIWDYTFLDGSVQGLQLASSRAVGSEQHVIVLSSSGQGSRTISRIGGSGPSLIWQHADSGVRSAGDEVDIATSKEKVYLIRRTGGITGFKATVTTLNIMTGAREKDQGLNLDADVVLSDGMSVSASGSAHPFIITRSKDYSSFKLNVLGENSISNIVPNNVGVSIQDARVHAPRDTGASHYFLLELITESIRWVEIYHVDVQTGQAKKVYGLPQTELVSSFSASSGGNEVFFTQVTAADVVVYSSTSATPLARFARQLIKKDSWSRDEPVLVTAEVSARDKANIAARVAVTSPEGNWYLIRNGEQQWSRPEMLAYTTKALLIEDSSVDSLVQGLKAEIASDPASAYVNRVYRHATELRHLPSYLIGLATRLTTGGTDEGEIKKSLAGSRSVIMVNSRSQMISMDASSGHINWLCDISQDLDGTDVVGLTNSEGLVRLDMDTGRSIDYDTTTGKLVRKHAGTQPAKHVVQIASPSRNVFVTIDDNGQPTYDSASVKPGETLAEEGNVFVTQNRLNEVIGWTVGTKISRIWSFMPTEGKVIDISGRPVHDPIASIGTVLGDRSVLYKYVTPNLVLITVTSATTITIYLLDAVTGTTLHTSSHSGLVTTDPISSLLSENWLTYTFTTSDPATSSLQHNLIISEFFESALPNDRGLLTSRTNYSSFSPDAVTPPHVQTRAYILTEPIQNLTVTQTAQGITSRQILAYAPNSQSVISIPRQLLDARRPIDRTPTSAEMEEGLYQYNPLFELDPRSYLSHARQVLGIDKIMTSPTLLESTSTVFAFGHDIFGTQVAPSQTFDVLGKDFKKGQLLATIAALYLGVLAVRPIVMRKGVERGWL